MKYAVYVISALTAIAACGCSNSEDFTLPQSGNNSITIELKQTPNLGGEEQSRTYLDESVNGYRSVCWSSGDRIMANELISSEAQIDEENAAFATFVFEKIIDYPCNILYPASFYKDATTVTLPGTQYQTKEGNIDTNTLPMATYATEEGKMPNLHHLTGILHLQLRAESTTRNNKIRLIEFWGASNEQVSGDFAIDYTTASLTPASNKKSARKVSVVLTSELSVDKVTNVFIVVPAQEYKSGFTVRVVNEVGHYLDVTKKSALSIADGAILKMPEFSFTPTGTLIGVEIPNGNR